MRRVGSSPDGAEASYFLEMGRRTRCRIEELLPDGWNWEGRRALDFGCGAGRTLREFLPEAERAEFWGCDIHVESIRWLREHLSPPLQVFEVDPGRVALPQADGYFDVIWAVSVFTHIDRLWAEWLLELRRGLADDGWLIVTFLNEGFELMWQALTGGEAWDEDRIGMSAFLPTLSWDAGGPRVFASEWWLRTRWGRAFSIEHLARRGFNTCVSEGECVVDADHGFVMLRKKAGAFTADDLRRPAPDEPREAVAALAEVERLREQLAQLEGSRSWRATEPLRAAGRVARRLMRPTQ